MSLEANVRLRSDLGAVILRLLRPSFDNPPATLPPIADVLLEAIGRQSLECRP